MSHKYRFDSALNDAIFEHDWALVAVLLNGGADLSVPHRLNGSTAIHFAAQSGHVELVERLVALGCNVNAKNFESLSPLYWAVSGYDKLQQKDACMAYAKRNTRNMVACLLRLGTDADRVSLPRALVNGHADVFELLVEHGCPLQFETVGYHRVWSSLHDAVRLHSVQMVELICRLGADLEFASELCGTAFALACKSFQCTECMRVLAEYGANLDPVYVPSGRLLSTEIRTFAATSPVVAPLAARMLDSIDVLRAEREHVQRRMQRRMATLLDEALRAATTMRPISVPTALLQRIAEYVPLFLHAPASCTLARDGDGDQVKPRRRARHMSELAAELGNDQEA